MILEHKAVPSMIFLIDGVKKAAKETKASSLFMNPWETQAVSLLLALGKLSVSLLLALGKLSVSLLLALDGF
ncbi:hypothetical protein [Leptospira borgpetersenii]|uniref:hypothetical protein n=1 Tax=Leptospira borgpetersenii TaxID=174 RepID=UPI00187F07C5|nr:hypothetical protein [Leptospira borgpetersenii]MBE8178285.1 hypothetical protein [Leptospira borgpetersenii serovar Ballum]MBE8197982.1 hypothetical protein [Leptospira borgpetersenii serovar Ballum]MBE8238829.1 hypothetical protein [Leptospira borgpetersenii serovar Ballum]MBE8278248.1 hypothetical protein [Leptospira borgpetersenii serovar Ballum]MBE8284600.1 hypothetical protein [Leptospira borgpetersenii serovar Ballum]